MVDEMVKSREIKFLLVGLFDERIDENENISTKDPFIYAFLYFTG
jgi:hypothetical protein